MRIVLVVLLALVTVAGQAQSGIKWKYAVRKISEDTCEVHITAYVSPSWHIYSQYMEEGGPQPTVIQFEDKAGFEAIGPVQEVGHAITRHEQVFDMDVTYYTDSVGFVQKLLKKSKMASVISGSVNYMICREDQCLAPTIVRFKVQLE
jgi:hypothetical protein